MKKKGFYASIIEEDKIEKIEKVDEIEKVEKIEEVDNVIVEDIIIEEVNL